MNPPQGRPQQQRTMYKSLVRLANTDLDGNKAVYFALKNIHGVSYGISNAALQVLNIDKSTKLNTLSQEQLQKIEQFISNPSEVPQWILNRRKDPESGQSGHLITAKLRLRNEFDIRNLKKIRTYRGFRHALGLPSRGQCTKAHFRKRGATVGVMKKTVKAAPKKEEKK